MKAAIIGVGKVGSLRLKILEKFKEIKKIYLVDKDRKKLSLYPSYESFSCYTLLKNKVDFVIISTPTSSHFEIAKFFLKNKIPTLVEKPLASSLKETNYLFNLSKKNKTLLFVGHTERYNCAYQKIRKIIHQPYFIECHRLSPYPYRSLDISVILDLMIHDLDLILELVKKREIKRIEAIGAKVLSSHFDIANARIVFKEGLIANLVASRISKEKMRKLRIFSSSDYISLDLARQKIEIYKKRRKKIQYKCLSCKNEPLEEELKDFLNQMKKKRFNWNSLERACLALKLALKIQKIIEKK